MTESTQCSGRPLVELKTKSWPCNYLLLQCHQHLGIQCNDRLGIEKPRVEVGTFQMALAHKAACEISRSITNHYQNKQAMCCEKQCGMQSWLPDFTLLLNWRRKRSIWNNQAIWNSKDRKTLYRCCSCCNMSVSLLVCCRVHMWLVQTSAWSTCLNYMLTITVCFMVLWEILLATVM